MDPQKRLYLTLVLLVIIALGSFILGVYYAKGEEQSPILITMSPEAQKALMIPKQAEVSANTTISEGSYFGSKNGTKYYSKNCYSSQKRISPENIVWFSTAEDAAIQGYSPSTSC